MNDKTYSLFYINFKSAAFVLILKQWRRAIEDIPQPDGWKNAETGNFCQYCSKRKENWDI